MLKQQQNWQWVSCHVGIIGHSTIATLFLVLSGWFELALVLFFRLISCSADSWSIFQSAFDAYRCKLGLSSCLSVWACVYMVCHVCLFVSLFVSVSVRARARARVCVCECVCVWVGGCGCGCPRAPVCVWEREREGILDHYIYTGKKTRTTSTVRNTINDNLNKKEQQL